MSTTETQNAAPAATPAAATAAAAEQPKTSGRPRQKTPENMEEYMALLKSSLKRAFGGGLAGAGAMVIQVLSLMWMRTIMNYQYRYGTTFRQAASRLYAEGGVFRFYKGVLPGLIQGPMSRFGDTASNAGMLAYLNSLDSLQQLPTSQRTLVMTGAITSRKFTSALGSYMTACHWIEMT